MSRVWPTVALKDVLYLNLDAVKVDPAASYPIAGVYSFGRGLLARSPILGMQTTYKVLHRLHKDDFVLSQLKGWEGALSRIPDTFDGWFLSPQFPTFRTVSDRLDIHYLDWYCKRAKVWEELKRKSQGMGARRDSISPAQFLSLTIPLPPLSEQRRIVARIEELAARIEEARGLRREVYVTIGALRASAMNALFSSGENASWPTVTLGEVADIQSGVTLGRMLNGPKITLPYLRVANVQDGYLDLSIMKEVAILDTEFEKWQLKSGDILLTEGGDWDKLGRGAVWRGEIPNCIHQNHIFCVRVNTKDFDPDYLVALISSPYGKSYFRGASKQTTNLATINQRQLKAFRVFKPPLLEQEHIVAYLDDLQSKVNSLKQLQAETSAELDALLPSILDKAFKGEL